MKSTNMIPTHWKWVLLALMALVLTLSGEARPATAAFPGVNGKIAFERTGAFFLGEIFAMDPDGSGQTALSNTPLTDTEPAWSPDGTQIAFRQCDPVFCHIVVMNADGSDQTEIHNEGFSPAWSPDGTQIAFIVQLKGDFSREVYVMNADGSGVTRLTNDPFSDMQPAWSPDGTQIAFSTGRPGSGGFDIYVMNADGSDLTNLTNAEGLDINPDWSPDGTQIAFTAVGPNGVDIFVMNADGSGRTNLTNNSIFEDRAAWSPDGSMIAFETTPTGTSQIFVMNADGSGRTNLSNDLEFNDFHPAWQPLPPQINITKLSVAQASGACFDVLDGAQSLLFSVCDNDFQGPPANHAVCLAGGVCNDVNPEQGVIAVAVEPGDYSLQESKAPVNHSVDPTKQPCTVTGEGTCDLTFTNEGMNDPGFPWDLDGDGAVAFGDFLIFVQHFGETKP